MIRSATLVLIACLPLLGTGCSGSNPYVQTDPDGPGIGTGRMTADPMNQMAEYFSEHLRNHRQVMTSAGTVRVLWLGLENRTSEIIEVDRIADRISANLSSGGWAQDIQFVVDRDMRSQLAAEISDQQGGLFNPATAAKFGQMVGAEYALAGRIYGEAQSTDDFRQRDYEMTLKLIQIQTGREWTEFKSVRFTKER